MTTANVTPLPSFKIQGMTVDSKHPNYEVIVKARDKKEKIVTALKTATGEAQEDLKDQLAGVSKRLDEALKINAPTAIVQELLYGVGECVVLATTPIHIKKKEDVKATRNKIAETKDKKVKVYKTECGGGQVTFHVGGIEHYDNKPPALHFRGDCMSALLASIDEHGTEAYWRFLDTVRPVLKSHANMAELSDNVTFTQDGLNIPDQFRANKKKAKKK